MVRATARLRQNVWWPNMDKQTEQVIRACHPCQLVGPRCKAEPIRSTALPKGPPTRNLVVVDNYSQWPEAILLKKTDAAHFTKAVESTFQTQGLPLGVRSENGPPFSSAQ